MRSFVLALGLVLVLGTAHWTQAYSPYQRPSSTTASPSSSCCDLSPWALEHMDAVRLMAERVRRYYNSRSRGGGFPRTYTHEWSESLVELTGKSEEEIDVVARRLCDKIITDMQTGRISYGVIAQPNYFESQAAAALEKLLGDPKITDQRRQVEQPALAIGPTYNMGKNNNTAIGSSGNVNVSKEDPWKRDERERLFWLLTKSSVSIRDLENWQRNQEQRLRSIALRSNKTLDEIKEWQRQELELFKIVINQFNNVTSDLKPWQKTERGRIDWLILQNEFTREELDRWQRKNTPRLKSLARQYRINIEELKEYQRRELERLSVILNQQNSQISNDILKVFENEERNRLNQILSQHNATINELQERIRRDKDRCKQQAAQYQKKVENMEKIFDEERNSLTAVIKQQQELKRITDWQLSERTRLEDIIREMIEKWLRGEAQRLKEQGAFSGDQENFTRWQRHERFRLQAMVQRNNLTIDELHKKIISDEERLQTIASSYQVRVEEIEDWIKTELLHLQSQWLVDREKQEVQPDQTNQPSIDMDKEIKANQLGREHSVPKEQGASSDDQTNIAWWQREYRFRLQAMVESNNLTIDELHRKIISNQEKLQTIAAFYQVRVEEIEDWIKTELLHLQSQWLVEREKLTDRQEVEPDMDKKIKANQLGREHSVPVDEIEDRIKKEGLSIINETMIEADNRKDWQKIERDRLEGLVNQSDFLIDDFSQKLKADYGYLHQLAVEYRVEVEEVKEFIQNELQRLRDQGKIQIRDLAKWQQKVRRGIEEIIQQQNIFNVEELEALIKVNRGQLQNLANQFQVPVDEVEEWFRKDLKRLQDQGAIFIESLTDWQLRERQRLEQVIRQNRSLTVVELEKQLTADKSVLQHLARQYWFKRELIRLENEGKLEYERILPWQQAETERIFCLAVEQNKFTLAEIEQKILADRLRLEDLSREHHISVQDIEQWLRSEAKDLFQRGIIGELKEWQQTERLRIQNLVKTQNLTIEQFQQLFKNDTRRLQNLAWQHKVDVEDVEEWVSLEGNCQIPVPLTAWQQDERQRLQTLIEVLNLTQDELEWQLKSDISRLQQISQNYEVSVEEIIEWIRKEGKRLIKPESLTPWQRIERQRLYDQLQQTQKVTVDEFEDQIKANRYRIQQVAQQYRVTVEEVEQWIRKEGNRIIKPVELNEWQLKERDNLIQVIVQNDLPIQELKLKLEGDRARLQQLANQFNVTIDDVEGWIIKEGQKLISPTYLTEWQRKEHENLLQQIRQNDLTIEQLKQQLQADRSRLQQLAQQYRVSIEDIQSWVLKEGEKLIKPVQVNEWQRKERENLVQLITQEDLTIPELRKRIEADRSRLQQLAQQYNVSVEEIMEWVVNEGQKIIHPLYLSEWQSKERDILLNVIRRKGITIEELTKWLEEHRPRHAMWVYEYFVTVKQIQDWILKEAQKLLKPVQVSQWRSKEHDNLVQLITQNDLTIEDLWQKIQADKPRLQQLAQQYHITVEEVEEWILSEGQKLIKPPYLSGWQIEERANLLRQIRQNDLTVEEFKQNLQADGARLQALAHQRDVPIKNIENWILREGQKLLKPIQVNEWQRREHANLVELITQNDLTMRDLKQKLKADRPRLQDLAQLSNVTVEEIEEWVVNEGQLLIKPVYLSDWQIKERDDLLQLIRQNGLTIEQLKRNLENDRARLQQLAYHYQVNIQQVLDWILREGQNLLKPVQVTEWQRKEHDNLVQLITQNDLTIQDLKQKIQADRPRLQWLARQYNVTMEEIEEWVINEGQGLINPAYLNEWQRKERDYLLQQIRRDHLTLKDLKQQIIADRARRQQVAVQYHVTIEEMEQWIINEGKKFIKPVVMNQWQQNEHDRLLVLVEQYGLTLDELKSNLQADRGRLKEVAAQYHVSVKEIEEWILSDGRRLVKPSDGNINQWQQHERKYLFDLAQANVITLRNFEEYLQGDNVRIENVASSYGATVPEIIAFLRKEVQRLGKLKLISGPVEGEFRRGDDILETPIHFVTSGRRRGRNRHRSRLVI